jgi:hypothetical protein
MNNKVLAAFVGGLIVASGITYLALRRPEPASVAQTSQPPTTVAPVPSAKAEAEPGPTPAPEQAPPAISARRPELLKPSPEVRRQSARIEPAPAQPRMPVPVPESPKPAPITVVPEREVARNPEPPPPAPEPVVRNEPPPAPPKPNSVTIPAGTSLMVRLGETLSTERSKAGDTFSATLDQPLVVDGFVIAEKGARAQGRVVESDRSGKVRGVALMQVELTQLTTSDGQKIRVNTAFHEKKAESTTKKDAAKVGIGAALGAAIGAIAGGGKGAGVGAGVGGAAGAGDVLLTRGKPVEFPVETRLSFRLSDPVTVTERLRN